MRMTVQLVSWRSTFAQLFTLIPLNLNHFSRSNVSELLRKAKFILATFILRSSLFHVRSRVRSHVRVRTHVRDIRTWACPNPCPCPKSWLGQCPCPSPCPNSRKSCVRVRVCFGHGLGHELMSELVSMSVHLCYDPYYIVGSHIRVWSLVSG